MSAKKEKKLPKILPAPGPVSRAGVVDNLTGSWRYLRPRYEEKLSPCIAACPAGERVELWIRRLQEGNLEEAGRIIREVNPFPRVCGRVCFHPCETECNRGQFDRPIAIHALERYIGDHTKSKVGKYKFPQTGKRIAVLGAGPAGLTCAFHLARLGHSVTIFEAETEPGGLLRYGIPAYRLPKDVLCEEIDNILSLGIDLKTGTAINDLEELRQRHDAVFLASGFGSVRKLGIPGEEEERVIDALSFLKLVNSGRIPAIGKTVLVIGGGNAAVDAARSALRLGAQPTLLYRRTRNEMPAYAPEVEEAQKEGVAIRYLVQLSEIARDAGGGLLVACEQCRLGEPDRSGRRQPEPLAGSRFLLQADTVITAIGEAPDNRLMEQALTQSKASAELRENVFIGGDLVTSIRTVSHAIGSGRRAAILIHASLGGSIEDPAAYPEHDVARFESLNMDYFPHKPRIRLPMLSLRERERTFQEIYRDIHSHSATEEAGRCFHCGACIACDTCRIYCPDIAIRKSGAADYSIDYDYCKGCGICAFECPRNAMTLDEETRL
ncbi:MAG: FAD-dependent oxidoreductase [Candidatus Abyssobacteria bacterium SURF_5]|uniref:FAD-dependent oxidoreductase n=1 Tax=Abyssobacteria bacterium (strain SURF_5) TaxID=2093360 RepID=A0A3A4NC22_ABYX5|nr:MAG: FAD-dependent oxidoreductase [Candidatus Abyssubacteria bacterium SURF_5]